MSVILFILVTSLAPGDALADAEPLASGPFTVSAPNQTYLTVGPTYSLIDSGCCDSGPQVFVGKTGALVVPYLGSNSAELAVVGLDPIQLAQGPTQLTVYGAEPDFASLDSQDRVAIVYERSAAQMVVYKVVSPSGLTLVNETAVGNLSVGTGFVTAMFTPSIAVGSNDTIAVVYSLGTNGSVLKLVLNVISSAGTPLVVDQILFDNSGWNRFPRLSYDALSSHFVVTWYDDYSGNYAMAFDANGSVVWGPKSLGDHGGPISSAIDSEGNVFAIWASGTNAIVTQISPSGTVLATGRTVIASSANVLDPSATLMPNGDMLFVWADDANGTDTDIRAQAISPMSLATSTPRVSIVTRGNGSLMPRVAFSNATTGWAVWADSNSVSQDIALARIELHQSGFGLSTPLQNVTLWRGEPLDIWFDLLSSADEVTGYDIVSRFQSFQGPYSWTAAFSPGLTTNQTTVSAGALGSSRFMLRLEAPVVGQDGYSAIVIVGAQDRNFPQSAASLFLEVTVRPGHMFAISPASLNFTARAGSSQVLPFDVTIAGSLDETAVALDLLNPPPAGWTFALDPPSVTGPPQTVTRVNLTVSIPAGATSADSFCSRLRIVSPNDSYSATSAGFCVQTLLESRPLLSPANASLSLSPGGTSPSLWNLTNSGNSASPMPCFVTATTLLPPGWSYLGNPAALQLRGNVTGSAQISIVADTHATGASTLDLTFEGSCEGTGSTSTGVMRVTVREVHSVVWALTGATLDVAAGEAAVFPLTVRNDGNVPESLAGVASALPPGWSAAFAFEISGTPVETVPAYTLASVRFTGTPATQTPQGSYSLDVLFTAGSTAPFAASFTARVTSAYGLDVFFEAPPANVQAKGQLYLNASVWHRGNVADTYVVHVDVNAPEYWAWSASYLAGSESDTSTYQSGTLTLAPFSTGVLVLVFTVPPTPGIREVSITVQLSNERGGPPSFTDIIHVQLPDLRLAVEGTLEGLVEGAGNATIRVLATNGGDAYSRTSVLRVTMDGGPMESWPLPALAPGEAAVFNLTYKAVRGPHTLAFELDPKGLPGGSSTYGSVFEADEANNTVSIVFEVAPPAVGPGPTTPHDTGGQLEIPAVLMVGGTVAVGAVVGLFLLRRKRHALP